MRAKIRSQQLRRSRILSQALLPTKQVPDHLRANAQVIRSHQTDYAIWIVTSAAVIFSFMFAVFYNTGARVSEVARLKLEDIDLDRGGTVLLTGKGRKQRTLPLWKNTVRSLRKWLPEIPNDGKKPVFPNAANQFLSRSGIESRLKRAVTTAAEQCPSLTSRSISPHTIRHTTAMHLLQSGVDITVIALWLGHENPATTHMYIEADLQMKRKALDRLEPPGMAPQRFKPDDALLQFLEGL
jgi:integrase/recombinase XerD